MSPLIGLSISLLALKLGGVSDVGYGLIILPAALQGALTIYQAYKAKREMDILIEAIEQAQKNIKKEE